MLPVLKQMPIDRLVDATGMHRHSLCTIRAGERRPHPRNRQALIATIGAFANERLGQDGMDLPGDDLAACATLLGRRAG